MRIAPPERVAECIMRCGGKTLKHDCKLAVYICPVHGIIATDEQIARLGSSYIMGLEKERND